MTPLTFWASVAEAAVVIAAVFFFVGVGLVAMAARFILRRNN